MYDIDPETMIEWLQEQLRIERVCIAHYQHCPQYDINGKYLKRHTEEAERLQERITMWEGMK